MQCVRPAAGSGVGEAFVQVAVEPESHLIKAFHFLILVKHLIFLRMDIIIILNAYKYETIYLIE